MTERKAGSPSPIHAFFLCVYYFTIFGHVVELLATNVHDILLEFTEPVTLVDLRHDR